MAFDELGDGAALHAHPGPDQGHLVGQLLEGAGAQPPGDLELGGRLQEEDPLGPAFVDQVVDVGSSGSMRLRSGRVPSCSSIQSSASSI